jgi:flagellin
MRINTNVSALNTYRQMNAASSAASKSMQKLSTGLRINGAADDAAGLAISEKMRAQIRGLDQSQRNAQDGVSLLQTAEGALNETHSILQRMRELAVQSSNDTNTFQDRENLQSEINQLAQEVGRIGSSTEFNGRKLLTGSYEGTFQIGANQGQSISIGIGDMQSFSLGITRGEATVEVSTTVKAGADGVSDFKEGSYFVREDKSGKYELVGNDGTVVASSTDGEIYTSAAGDDTIEFTGTASNVVTSGAVKIDSAGKVTAEATSALTGSGLQAGEYTYDSAKKGLVDGNGNVVATEDSTAAGQTFIANGNTVLDFSDAAILNGTKVTVGGSDIRTTKDASEAITKINDAIEKVSTERSKMGAVQNRLEFATNNISSTSENIKAAESRIRDTDMAKEMMEFTKNNILSQAAQAMMAQANQQPQAVLQLLR